MLIILFVSFVCHISIGMTFYQMYRIDKNLTRNEKKNCIFFIYLIFKILRSYDNIVKNL